MMLGSSKGSEPRRRRKKEHDSDRDEAKSKDKERRKTARSSAKRSPASSKASEPSSPTQGRPRASSSQTPKKVTMAVPEVEHRSATASPSETSRASLPYPSFSKAHSKEAVGGRENVVNPRLSLYTPDPTDLGDADTAKANPTRPTTAPPRAPPSPPLTATDPDLKRASSGQSMRRDAERLRLDTEGRRRKSADDGRRDMSSSPRPSTGRSSLRKTTTLEDGSERTAQTGSSRTSFDVHEEAPKAPNGHTLRPPERSTSVGSARLSNAGRSNTDSDATSVAPEKKQRRRAPPPPVVPDNEPSPIDSSPRTPTPQEPSFPTTNGGHKSAAPVEIIHDVTFSPQPSAGIHPASFPQHPPPPPQQMPMPPPPPPPPPPPMSTAEIPRVDYLLQNGGLLHPVPRQMLAAAGQQAPTTPYSQYASPRIQGASLPYSIPNIFAPFQEVLEGYDQVIQKHGSIAVATGYRSVARRLLDRLEAVFARNISSETCHCIMCRSRPGQDIATEEEEEEGVSWGEILEYVAGRRDYPAWPPFSISPDATDATGLGISGFQAPMQKLDIDVPEEFRDHYIRQSKKTKNAVQQWLASQPETPSSPPQEVDDETLTFAILTHIEPEQRQVFTALIRGLNTLPGSRNPTPLEKVRPELLVRTSLALQRLYHLERPPRDPETTYYLLKYPELHNVLATLAAVSAQEWEILISGRFDGFLWSGAEAPTGIPNIASPLSRGPSRGANPMSPLSRTNTPYTPGLSRGPTPFGATRAGAGSRGPTPAPSSFGAPVQMDEETEIAILAEVEREIYLGMEALEDAFEALHCKAQSVRQALRERSTGLAMAAQARRGSNAQGVEVRLGTPASAMSGWDESETDEAEDMRSELGPDDSASNISFNRRRRKRNERRTPAMVEEEDESDITDRARR